MWTGSFSGVIYADESISLAENIMVNDNGTIKLCDSSNSSWNSNTTPSGADGIIFGGCKLDGRVDFAEDITWGVHADFNGFIAPIKCGNHRISPSTFLGII